MKSDSFMKGKSCLTAFYDDTTSSEDEGRVVGVGYLDFRKAFDSIP